jgi:hypothetical protein
MTSLEDTPRVHPWRTSLEESSRENLEDIQGDNPEGPGRLPRVTSSIPGVSSKGCHSRCLTEVSTRGALQNSS